jgi:hypothetical protein
MKNEKRPVARRANLVVQHSGDEILVYDLETNQAKCLNSSSAAVWQLCEGTRSETEIANELTRSSKTAVSGDFVGLAISELARNGLMEDTDCRIQEGMSRRQLIKHVGMTSMIALPLIASIVAPQAVLAQTCIANNLSCTLSAQCCSTCCKNVSPSVNQCKPGGGACLP